jgi:hypothetical protein
MDNIPVLMIEARKALKKGHHRSRQLRTLILVLCLEDSDQFATTWFNTLPINLNRGSLEDDTLMQVALGGLPAFSEHYAALLGNEQNLLRLRGLVRSNQPHHISWVMPNY